MTTRQADAIRKREVHDSGRAELKRGGDKTRLIHARRTRFHLEDIVDASEEQDGRDEVDIKQLKEPLALIWGWKSSWERYHCRAAIRNPATVIRASDRGRYVMQSTRPRLDIKHATSPEYPPFNRGAQSGPTETGPGTSGVDEIATSKPQVSYLTYLRLKNIISELGERLVKMYASRFSEMDSIHGLAGRKVLMAFSYTESIFYRHLVVYSIISISWVLPFANLSLFASHTR